MKKGERLNWSLFMMGIEILETEEIQTRRTRSDLILLNEIRNGKYTNDEVFVPEFYELVSDYEKRFEYAEEHSSLPGHPDMEAIEQFTEEINRHVILGDF